MLGMLILIMLGEVSYHKLCQGTVNKQMMEVSCQYLDFLLSFRLRYHWVVIGHIWT